MRTLESSLPDFSVKKVKGEVNSLLKTVKKENGSVLVNDTQAQKLSELKFSDGETILSLEDRYFLFEVFWMLDVVGYEKTFNFLSANWEKVFGRNNLRKMMLFENPLLEKTKEKFILDMDIFKNTVQVEAGEKCRKCGSEETMSVVSQTRSCDEAATIKITCLSCKNRWTAQ